jgi:VWFA-related protein
MRKYLLPQVLLIGLLSATVLSQSSNQSNGQPGDKPVKLSVTLVQVDAIVTDSHGHQVTNLRPEDFQVSIHGRQQRITSLSYEHFGRGGVTPAAAANPDGTGPPASESSRTATTSPRVLAFVLDDLLSSFDSIVRTKLLLHQFIDEKMEPGDMVAIAHTGGGIGALQSFTSDKGRLHQAVDRLNWNPVVLGRLHAGDPIESTGIDMVDAMVSKAQGEIDQFRHEVFSAGTLGSLTFLVRQLKVLPGRKSLVLLSDGFRLPGISRANGFPLPVSDADDSLIDEPLRRLVDLANRASVAIYTIHTPGLQYLGLTAADSFTAPGSIAAANRASDRQLEFALSQQGLAYLAKETGGFAVQNRNDLGQGLDRILNDESGYYLIGFVPDDRTFRRDGGFPVFNEIRIKVKQPGLTIRHRKGFYSIPEKERVMDPSPRASLYDALISPIGADKIDLRVTSLFASDPKTGSFIRSLLHLDTRNLTFADDGDGWHKASFDVLAVTFGQDGEATVNGNRTETLRVRGPDYEHLLSHGLVYTLNLPVKRPGFYQLRVAVRDAASERIGSATQFVEAPDLSTGRLTLSGIALMSGATGKPRPPAVAAPEARASVASEPNDDANESAAIRLFHTGEDVALGLVIFNARGAPAQDTPNLTLQTRIYRDGKLVNAGPVSNLNPAGAGDWHYVAAHGTLHLGGLQPGHYSLEVICKEKPLKGKSRVATQWTDFEIGA